MDHRSLEKLEYSQVRRMVAEHCRCALGVDLAGKMKPSDDFEQVRQWLARTDAMVTAILQAGLPPFGGITDVSEQLARIRPGGGPDPDDFKMLASTLIGAGAVRRWLESLGEGFEIISGIGGRIDEFDALVAAIARVIDDRGEVRDSASERLRSIRRDLESMRNEVRTLAHEYIRRPDVARCLQSPTVQMYEDRFVLPLKAEHRGRVRGVIHRTSGSGATLFIEPEPCLQLNNQIVTLLDKQHDEIVRLLNELAIRVHAHDGEIRRALRILAAIDLLAAKAQVSIEAEMTSPALRAEGPVRLRDARHPLLLEHYRLQRKQRLEAGDLAAADTVEPVVPIDIRLGDDFRILVVTGSNTGGKTVAIKTLGLLAAMVQSGMHIPAAHGAEMPVFKDILLDVGDEQSLQQSLSTFGGHLKRINRILRRSGPGVLVLLDELGSGTDPDEGGAIGQAVLDELLDRGAVALVTTHLGVLKAYAYSHDEVDNASVEFNVKTLRPTYKLLIGEPGESHAIVIAERYGLPRRLIRRARRHLPKTGARLRQAIAATTESRRASEQALREAELAAGQAKEIRNQYDDKLADLEQTRKRFAEWLGTLHAMKSGDEIYVRSFKRMARLVRLQLSRQIAVVDLNGLEAEVPLQDIMPDLGDTGAADEVYSLRDRIRRNRQAAEQELELARQARREAEQQLQRINQRQLYVNDWLKLISGLTVGSTVEFTRKPHTGKVAELDLPNGKVTVTCDQGEIELPVQELFPHTGAFDGRRRKPDKKLRHKDENRDRPVHHRNPKARKTRDDMVRVAELKPGDPVYLTMFRQNGSVVKLDADRGTALVQAGAFEISVPMTDLAPIRQGRDQSKGT